MLLCTIILVLGIETSGFGALNPTNGLTNIQVQATGEVNGELIMVINLNGKVMAEYQLAKGESNYTLDATNWAAGMYIATYSANGAKPVTRTFIVQ